MKLESSITEPQAKKGVCIFDVLTLLSKIVAENKTSIEIIPVFQPTTCMIPNFLTQFCFAADLTDTFSK
jgi:hypothetical protein